MTDILFLTELIGLKVYDLRGRRIGRVKDAAIVPLIDPARVDRFLIGGGWAWLSIRHDQVKSISLDEIHLSAENLTPFHSDEYVLRVVRDLLDQQIIDAKGRKVVRVTDLTFSIQNQGTNQILRVEDIDIGIRSIFRRLVQGVLPPRWIRKLQDPISPNSIDWAKCNILEPDPMRRLRLNISTRLLEEMHPADLADIVEELGPDDREAIFSDLDSEVAAETLSEIEPDVQASILESLETGKAAEIVEEMSPDEAADLLKELETETAGEILAELEGEPKEDIEELLEFRHDTAGGLMNTEYIALPENATVHDLQEAARSEEYLLETLSTIFLINADQKLAAVVPVARLLLQGPDVSLQSLAVEQPVSVTVTEKRARIVEIFDKYNLLCLPVVNDTGELVGVITADDIISLLRNK